MDKSNRENISKQETNIHNMQLMKIQITTRHHWLNKINNNNNKTIIKNEKMKIFVNANINKKIMVSIKNSFEILLI